MANDTDLPQSEVEDPGAGFRVDGLHATNASPPRFGRLALCVATLSALASGVLGTVAYGVWFNQDQQAYAEAIAGARQELGVPASASASAVAASRLAKPVTSTWPAVTAAAPQTATASAPTTTRPVVTPAPVPAVAAATSGAPATMTPASAQTASTLSPAQSAWVPAGEEGSTQAVWSGPIAQAPAAATPETTLADAMLTDATLADATPAAPVPVLPSTRRATSSADSAAQQPAAGRSGKEPRIAQQERRTSTANARHKSNLFARMGVFFRRVNYRQHDSGRRQQDIYSHP